MQKIIGIKFKSSGKVYSFDPNGKTYEVGDKVVVDSASSPSLGEVAFKEKEIDEAAISEPLKPVLRKATEADISKYNALREKADKDIFVVRDKVRELGLEMKIVSAEYTLDSSKIVIEFSAEDRVDFRELLKELASILKVRIELHQVGQRDEVKIKGGLGPCGEVCCCTRFLKDFEHVTVKMAKNQGLSLSPTKISGLCGRLMCCLAYENKTYEEILQRMPKVGSHIWSPKGMGNVVYNDILRERVSVKVQGADESYTVYDFALSELDRDAKKQDNADQKEKSNKPSEKLRTFIENKPAVQNQAGEEAGKEAKPEDENKQAKKPFKKRRHFKNKLKKTN